MKKEEILTQAQKELDTARVHNQTMIPWWDTTVKTLDKQLKMLEQQEADFNKISTALQTVCPNGTPLTTDMLTNDEELTKALATYTTTDSVIGPIVKAAKETITPIVMLVKKFNANIEMIGRLFPDNKPKPVIVPRENVTAEVIRPKKSFDEKEDYDRTKTIERIPLTNGWMALSIPDIPEDLYMINSNTLVVNRKTGRTLHTKKAHGVEVFYFMNTDKPTSFPVEIPLSDIKEYIVSPDTTRIENDEYRWLDWIPELPKRKYKVYKSGRIWDAVQIKYVATNNSDYVYLSASDYASRVAGVTNYSTNQKVATLVWKAFHPEDRNTNKLYLTHIDGNIQNAALDNLKLKRGI